MAGLDRNRTLPAIQNDGERLHPGTKAGIRKDKFLQTKEGPHSNAKTSVFKRKPNVNSLTLVADNLFIIPEAYFPYL